MSDDPNPSKEVNDSLPRCLTCDYALAGLSENRCPECGREFDPDDPSTMYSGRKLEGFARFLLSPPRKPTFVLLGLLVVATCVSCSVPGSVFVLLMLCIWGWLGLMGVWLLRLLMSVVIAIRSRYPLYQEVGTYVRWAIPPLALALVVLLCSENVPLRVTFHVSRPAMDRFAQEILALPPQSPIVKTRWLGLYAAKDIERCGTGIRFIVSGTGFLDREGWAYSVDGPPPAIGEDHYTHFAGPWYIWRESW